MKREVRLKKYFRDRIGRTQGLTGVGGKRGCDSDGQKPLVVRAQSTRKIQVKLACPSGNKMEMKERTSYSVRETMPCTLLVSG